MIKRCVLCYHICPDLLLLGKISNIYIEAGLYATLVYLSIIIPSPQWGRRGVYWSHLVPLSVCGQNRVCYSSYRTTSEGVSGVFFFKLKIFVLANSLNFELWLCLVLTYGGGGGGGLSSECRRSSSSSFTADCGSKYHYFQCGLLLHSQEFIKVPI